MPSPTQSRDMAGEPSALEQSIRGILATHGLDTFSLTFIATNDRIGLGWSIGLQRWEAGKPVQGWSGDGVTIAVALAHVLDRLPRAAVLADEALPESA